ncbi:MAG: hypothetical protein ACYSXF_06840 [Planctomycetota bacterium]
MSDVLCDFCHGEWTDDQPMLEGHHGSCVCGTCLTLAYRQAILNGDRTAPADFKCPMCLESKADREALGRSAEGGWRSPVHQEAVICERCIKLAAGALHKSKDWGWTKPTGSEGTEGLRE